MQKRFSRYRLKKDKTDSKKTKKRFFWKSTLTLFLFLLCIPLFRIGIGPFGSFLPHIGKFWNTSIVFLLQNESELRPAGGFISAVALIKITNGIPSVSVFDSYSISPSEKKVRAPQPLENIFSQDPKYEGWTFRDSNFSPDFPESAKESLHFLQYDHRFSRENISAVVALNFSAFESIFSEFGPVQGVSSDNLFSFLQRKTKDIDLHSLQEIDKRKDILGDLGKDLVRKIGYWNMPKMLNILEASAQKKEVQMWFSDASLQSLAEKKGWSGSLPLENFFAVNIANIGAKKSNRYVTSDYSSDIIVDQDGEVREEFSLRLKHRGTENIYSGPGKYSLRLYRPYQTVLDDTSDIWSQKTFPGQREEFSSLFSLAPGETKTLSVSFLLPEKWTIGSRKFLWSAQSGNRDQLTLTFRGPGDSSFSAEGCQKTYAHENTLFCSSDLDSDASFFIEMHTDILPPLLENIFFENPRELSVRFSEPVAPDFPLKNFVLRCKEDTILPSKIFRNQEYTRDVRVVFEQKQDLSGDFCDLTWKNISDVFGNTKDIHITLPFREEL